ncbi:DNase I-like protein [Wolfiporia cocos MD-104 SS10]|uniref:DNase I-like protein n=1 Tax=Wolfiporia cocos (strain MD-104) TaxID=742152 RepID=A0A2H3JY96_WOLCO|nr:DNase I-like protein [Wolfiporia cocos MD-104 SS10]
MFRQTLPFRPRSSLPKMQIRTEDPVTHTQSNSSDSSYDPFEGSGDTSDSSIDSDGTEIADPPPLPTRRNGLPNSNGHVYVSHSESELLTESPSSSAPYRNSSETNVSTDHAFSPPVQHPRHSMPPPRPPPRHKPAQPSKLVVNSPPSSISALSPPPLPARKGPATPIDELPRRPPTRASSMLDSETSFHSPSPPIHTSVTSNGERKTFGSHPPPPTRTIGLGDKLPPPRRNAPSDSSGESEEEDLKKVELLPDTSRSSRRPPTIDCHNYSEFNIHVPAYTSAVAASGHTVAVGHHHHLKIYDLSVSEAPVWNIDTREAGLDKLNGFKITALEFRPVRDVKDRGCLLWVGTKDGTLLELDVRTGCFVGWKASVHAHTVTHMFRHARAMVTLDDTGKVLVFAPENDSADDIHLTYTQPRVVRIADKQEFAKMLGGQLWTSTRDPGGGGTVASTSRGPIVRVYDVFSPGSTGRSLLPTEHLGAVTAGTILPIQPDKVYLGHEGGSISIWALHTKDGVPMCEEVVKVSSSDILSLEGVNDRLWAGGRTGMISAYDVVHRPWVVTNCWQAHTKLPVLRLSVDTWSIEKLGRLTVFSVGRDEKLRFWDGLLGTEWVDHELMKRETEFSKFRDINVLIVSWNLDSAKPDALNGCAENINFIHDALASVEDPDVIAFGFQELIDLESRKMAAKTVLLGGKNKNADGAISQKVTTSYKKWYDRLVLAVKMAMPPDVPYTVVHTENLVGLFSCIFVKNTERISLKQVAIATIKRGMGGRYGNKGGIVARFVIDDTSICFINCHLAAGQHHVRQRNADVTAMLEEKSVFPESDAIEEPLAYVNGGDGSMVLDHEMVFLNGDMNYRIDQRREPVISAVKAGELESLFIHDQLNKEMKFNRGFRLRSFQEGPITFAPTYKYDRRSSEYDTSEKARVPAWCDRVLWRSRDPSRVHQLHYKRYEANVSDHRPISAAFRMTVKSVQHEARARIKAEVEAAWKHHEQSLLQAAHQFFIDQAMI